MWYDQGGDIRDMEETHDQGENSDKLKGWWVQGINTTAENQEDNDISTRGAK